MKKYKKIIGIIFCVIALICVSFILTMGKNAEPDINSLIEPISGGSHPLPDKAVWKYKILDDGTAEISGTTLNSAHLDIPRYSERN